MRSDIFGRVAPLAAIAAAIFAFGVGLNATQAEDAKPADAKPATTTTTTAPATKTAETKTAAAPSPCKGLDETACRANSVCTWFKETKLKSGKTRKAHCRKKWTPPMKKAGTT